MTGKRGRDRRWRWAAATLVSFGTACTGGAGGAPQQWVMLPQPPAGADLLIVDAHVVTNEPTLPIAESIALAGGKVASVGSREHTRASAGANTVLLSLEGAVVLPGLVDAHAHVASLGDSLETVDLVGTGSYDEVLERVERQAANQPAGWILGRGWDQNDWTDAAFPDGRRLEEVAPGRAVWLRRVDGHAGLASAAALEAAGVTAETAEPDGGRILRRGDGAEPTGVLVDRAMDLVAAAVPPDDPAAARERLVRALGEISRVGLTGVHDMGVSAATLAAYEELAQKNELPVRIYAALSDDEALLAERYPAGPLVGDMLTLRAVKLYADGALGSRGAALLSDYSDDEGNRGQLVTLPDELRAKVRAALTNGFQPCIHAIGDRANRFALDVIQEAVTLTGVRAARPRIEHAQVVALDDLSRFRILGVVPSVQPTHATSDMPWVETRLGAERIRGAYAWRTLADTGVTLALGSDFPVERPHVLEGLFAAVSRTDRDARPFGGWRPSERLTFAEAVAGFTTGAAYAAFVENRRGRLVPGADADLTVVSANVAPLARGDVGASPSALLDAEILMTVVAGRVTYTKED